MSLLQCHELTTQLMDGPEIIASQSGSQRLSQPEERPESLSASSPSAKHPVRCPARWGWSADNQWASREGRAGQGATTSQIDRPMEGANPSTYSATRSVQTTPQLCRRGNTFSLMYTGLNIACGSVSQACLNLFSGCYQSDFMVIIPSPIPDQKLGDVLNSLGS